MGHFINLHELFEIVRQSSDSEFAQILNHIREGKYTEHHVVNIKKLADTDTSQWPPNQFVKSCLTNLLIIKENKESLLNLDTEVFVINVEVSGKDLETGVFLLSVPDNLSLNQTANLPTV